MRIAMKNNCHISKLPIGDITWNSLHTKYNCIVELSAFFEAAAIGFVFIGGKTMRYISRIYTVVGLVLIVTISHCFSAEVASIYEAAKLGDLDRISVLLEQGTDLNAKDEDGQTALHVAVSNKRKDVAELLIDKGADVNAKSNKGYPPLYSAIWNNDANIVEILVAKGADVTYTPEKDYPPLHYAVWSENLDMARVLVNNGAKWDVKDQDGWTAFRYAADAANKNMIELFVEKGADISGIHRAACLGDLACVEALLEQGTDIDVKDDMGWTPLYWAASMGQEEVGEFLLSKGAQADIKTGGERTPLHQAAYSGSLRLVELLVSKGTDVNAKDKRGNTPLHNAAAGGRSRIAELLIAKGANVNAKAQNNSTPLHRAAISGHKYVVEILLANGAGVTIKDGRGRTPVNWASQRSHTEIVKMLVDSALREHIGDESGQTILHKVSSEGWIEALQHILQSKPDLNVQDKQGLTPLHLAVSRVQKDIVEHLIVNGAKPNVKDNAGRTALHYAAGASVWTDRNLEQSTDIVLYLLEKGADINTQDNIGWTPLHYAARFRHESALRLLLEKGADPSIADNRGQTPLSLIQRLLSQIRAHGAEKQRTIEFNKIIDSLRPYTRVYYVSPGGKDSNPGTMEHPLKSIHAAVEVAGPGDNIIVRSGTYVVGSTIHLVKSGTADKPITLRAHPGDSPKLDFSGAKGIGIRIVGAYWHIKGLTIVNAETNGIRIEGDGAHHNIIEQTTTYANQLGGSGLIDGAAFNLFLNCDSYKNFDTESNGENADGIYVARSVGQGNLVIGCRSWNNADDGYDMWEAGNRVWLERCYAWRNGDNIWNHPFYTGNGNGFKLGQLEGDHLLIHCIAWDHPWRGFDLNGNSTGVTLHNCTAFRNNINYAFTYSKGNIEKNVLRGNLSYKGLMQIRPEVDDQYNSWNMPLDTEISEQDFVSLDDSIFIGPRNPDGSIPQNDFLKLAPGSAAIDKGVDIGMPFVGKRPDLGAFEYDPNETSQGYVKMLHQAVRDHDVKQIEQLLAQGEGIDEKDWLGYTPLHWAVYFGYSDLIELLISKGADPDIQSDTGRYALEIARAMTYPELEALLRKHGAKAGDVSTNEGSQETKATKEQEAIRKKPTS